MREEHPLFEEKPDVSAADYADLTAQVKRIAETMRELDPVAHFTITARLDLIHRAPDDGSALFLLSAGDQQIRAVEGGSGRRASEQTTNRVPGNHAGGTDAVLPTGQAAYRALRILLELLRAEDLTRHGVLRPCVRR